MEGVDNNFLVSPVIPNVLQKENVKQIKRLVASHVPAATLLSNVGAEISFQLPNDVSPAFKGMLFEIDNRKELLNIARYAHNSVWTCGLVAMGNVHSVVHGLVQVEAIIGARTFELPLVKEPTSGLLEQGASSSVDLQSFPLL